MKTIRKIEAFQETKVVDNSRDNLISHIFYSMHTFQGISVFNSKNTKKMYILYIICYWHIFWIGLRCRMKICCQRHQHATFYPKKCWLSIFLWNCYLTSNFPSQQGSIWRLRPRYLPSTKKLLYIANEVLNPYGFSNPSRCFHIRLNSSEKCTKFNQCRIFFVTSS